MSDETPFDAWRKRLARPLLLLGMIGGAVIFLPRMTRHEVRLVPRADDASCASWANVVLKQDGKVLRTFKVPAAGDRTFSDHTVHLAAGEYTAAASLECDDGDVAGPDRQDLVVDGEATLYLRIRSRCLCATND